MNITRKKINNVLVTIINTNKFKRITGTLYFKSNVTKENVTYRTILRNILIESCKKYDTSEKLYINTLKNYDAYYSAASSRCGNALINSFAFSSLEDKYTVNGNFDNVIDTFCEIIFNPLVKEEKFDEETFNIIVNAHKSDLEKIKESSDAYAERRLYKNLNQNKAYTYLNEIEYLEKLTPETLYKEYLDMINNSEVELVLAGNINFDNDAINKITYKIKNNKKYDNDLIIKNDDEKGDLVTIKEKGNGTQNILNIIMYLKDCNLYELNYVAPLYRIILGGGVSSRLFSVIREQNSLSYYSFARLEKDDSLIEIIMGIEKENYDKALNLTFELINDMNKITDTELKDAKKIITSSLLESQDNIFNVVKREYNSKLFDLSDLDSFIEKINKVTKEEVETFANKLKPNLCYFLEGEKTNG